MKVRPHQHGDEFTAAVKKMVRNYFHKFVMVKDYPSALRISKKYGLTCITPDGEVAEAGGYVCRVGKKP